MSAPPTTTPPTPTTPTTPRARILMVVENLPVPRDQRVWNEATTLRDAGYEVSVICPAGTESGAGYELRDGIHIHRHPAPPERESAAGFLREYASALFQEWRLARRIWRDRGFDVIHLANPPDLLFLIALPYKLRHGTRVVFDHHDLAPELFESKFSRRGPLYYLLRLVERLTFATADLVVSTNESFREIAVRRGGMDPAAVRVVRNGPDPERLHPGLAEATDAAAGEGSGCTVGWVGHVNSQAGLDHLVRAVAHIVHTRGRGDVRFLLIGDGPALEPVRELAGALAVRDQIEFSGPLFGPEMVARLATCDVGVVPWPKTPQTDRSTAIKTMEYMALGLPVVQFDLLEGRRTAGDAALHAGPGDASELGDRILWLADRPEERRRLGRLGRERVVAELAWSLQARELVRAYEDLLGGDAP